MLEKIKELFSFDDMNKMYTAFAYSKCYNGCQTWFLPSLHKSYRQKLFELVNTCFAQCIFSI